MYIHTKSSKPVFSELFDVYWYFAAERQRIFFKKIANEHYPWTDDIILRDFKFTNAYRASDRVSQYLIQNVIYQGDQSLDEIIFRILIFKCFNSIKTWERMEDNFKEIRYDEYIFEEYDWFFTKLIEDRTPIFSSSYIMPSKSANFTNHRKHRNFLNLFDYMMKDGVSIKIANTKKMNELFQLLLSYPLLGSFLAYQLTIDINYSNIVNFDENEFVVPGPGAKSGIRKCFIDTAGFTDTDLVKMTTSSQEEHFSRLNLEFLSLWGRPLQLIDCQNVFCEIDKYSRLSHPHIKGTTNRTRIKARYVPNHSKITYWYPPKWNINHYIS